MANKKKPIYECMVITKGNDENYVDKFVEIIKELGGKIEKVDKWGVKRLAYEICGLNEGFYTLIKMDTIPQVIKELDRRLKLDENVLRHLLIRGA